jgi:DNA-binding response OmpR family regulator
MIENRLKAEGFIAESIYEGTGAMGKIKNFLPQLILLDIMLPGRDGRDILIDMKKDPELKDIPVIIISGKDEQLDEAYGLKLGAIDYIMKPFSLSLLSDKIKRLLKDNHK